MFFTQHYFTILLHNNNSSQQYSTILLHNNIPQYFSTTVIHNTSQCLLHSDSTSSNHTVTQPLYESRMYWIHDPAPPTSRRPNLEFAGTPAPAIAKEFLGALSTQPKHKKSRRRRRRKATRTANQNAERRSATPMTSPR